MILFGSLFNVFTIIVGTLIGRFLYAIPERMKETIRYGIGMAVGAIGLQMTFETTQIVIVMLSIVIGAILGEIIDLDQKVNQLGHWIDRKLPTKKAGPGIAQGFVTATLFFCVGSMAIIGAIDSGLRNDHNVLVMKGILDGFTSIIFSSTLGIGVAFAAVPLFIYQGSITFLAT